jgi:hypothetical protein
VHGDWFVQVLEAAVRDLYARIERDVRHGRVALLDTRTVDHRFFGRWAMARVSDQADQPHIP